VIEDCFPPSTLFNRLMSTDDLRFFVDQDSNLYDMATGYCVATSLLHPDSVQLTCLALNGAVVVGSGHTGYLQAVRVADGKVRNE
jgi:hypothetical protein